MPKVPKGMIIFLYGQDTFRASQKLKEIIGSYRKKNRGVESPEIWDCQDKKTSRDVFLRVAQKIRQASLLKERDLLVVKNPFSGTDFKEKFEEEAENFKKSKDVIVFFQQGQADKRTSLFKLLLKSAKCQEFNPIEGVLLKNWIKKELNSLEKNIEQKALDILADWVGSDLWRMSNEIKKLANFAEKTIHEKDVALLLKPKTESDIFKTIDALAQKDKKQALNLVRRHMEKGDSPLYVLAMINFQFRNLLAVKQLIEQRNSYGVVLKKSGLHPFVAQKSYFQSRGFTFAELKKIYQKIFEADYDIKTGKIEPETAIDLLIEEI